MTECGGLLNKSIIEAKLADELIQFVAPKILGDISAKGFAEGFHRTEIKECNKLKIVSTKVLGRNNQKPKSLLRLSKQKQDCIRTVF